MITIQAFKTKEFVLVFEIVPDNSTNSSNGKSDQETNELIKCLFVSRWTENIKWLKSGVPDSGTTASLNKPTFNDWRF